MLRSLLRGACVAIALSLLNIAAIAANVFSGPFDYPAGIDPSNLTMGDVDGDGDLDLVACDYINGLVTVLLNDGAGSFVQAPGSPLRDVRNPISAELGRFNGDVDGTLDLVVVGFSIFGSSASVFLGDGTGRFSLSSVLPLGDVGFIGRKAAARDFDGDGRDDLALADREILLGRGDGTFLSAAPLPVGFQAFDVIAGDFDGDGRPDLAYMSYIDDTLHVLLVGAGATFSEAAGSPLALVGEPESLAAGDFDGDGDLDLAVTDIFGQRVFVLLNDGRGGFAPASFSPVSVRAGYPRGIAAADFDGDGRADLAVGSNNSPDLSVLLAGGATGLTEIAESPLRLTVGGPISIVAGDLDGDGDPDLAAVDFQGGRIAVFLNVFAPVVQVPIDILPGSDQNVIRLGGHGVVPVAILSTPELDATTVDPSTVLLAGSPVRRTNSGVFLCQKEMVNQDALVDLLCKVETEGLRLSAGDTIAVLEGVTYDGIHITGRDKVRVLPAK